MSPDMTAEDIRDIALALEGWKLPDDFQMPTLQEIENDLALASPGWQSLLRDPENQTSSPERVKATYSRSQRIVWLEALIAGAILGAACVVGVRAATGSYQMVSVRPVAAHVGSPPAGSHIIWTARGPIYFHDLDFGTCDRPRGHLPC